MRIDKIEEGVVLDHIAAGKAIDIYQSLNLGELGCTVAIITNARSSQMGKKDIIKIEAHRDLDLKALGYLDPGITVNIVQKSKIVDKKNLELPDRITDIIKCKNPRCITSTESNLVNEFVLTDRENGIYRCLYCEAKAER
ncbi:MAG: aspartate carbamoyltransferase regulatory subunit [Clostridiaceae bacterium]|nr:aspartate carbamoyltransferase regulatory subunit [Clostridiaceae bacterium]